ncbi:MAG: type II 3-dehydroquinate dehydratase [Porticoccaceae bacterium]|nr:type II 3-dehydroquinate dehydratase [Porticoccaceae bacterium]|tara:strand:- start:847 stop:1287 length:441 start_codon:yes stop_codon:yes gene_type:complete
MSKILILNGPNLNLLGTREPEVYGVTTLQDINKEMSLLATTLGHEVVCKQSNAEHELIEMVHETIKSSFDIIILNPGGYTHTSISLRDALLSVDIPFIEVHLSNVHNRENFRKHSYFSDIAKGTICGFGKQSYELAIQSVENVLRK